MEPISLKRILAPKNLLNHDDIFGSLDRGCSLTKLMYVKSVPGDDDKVSLEMAVFPNKNFSEALDWLAARAKEEGQFGVGKKMRVTGVGGEKYKAEIEDTLKMEAEFIHEFVAQQTGAHFLICNFDDDVFCYPESSTAAAAPPTNLPEWVLKMHMQAEEHFRVNDGTRFPAIFGFCGSGIGFNKLNDDATTEVLGVTVQGGKSFLGLSKLLLGTNNYSEIMSLAEKGFRGNVDTQVAEMFALGEKSEYRTLPPEMPLFPFGKASEADETNFRKEDMAASVIGSLVHNLMPMIAAYAKMHRIRRIYLGGHLFSGQPIRDIFNVVALKSLGMRPLNVRFLSNGHTGCIGCILLSVDEALQKRNKISMG